jgi:hypothetical protein
MTSVYPPVESLVRILIYVGGVATTVVGSWVSSKIHAYHENRKAHLEEIKQKVLIPLRDRLAEEYGPLVSHRTPVVIEIWGVRSHKENVSVAEYPNEQGPLLTKVTPDIMAATDPALYTDARKNHFTEVTNHAEQFLTAWNAHADECYAWVLKLSEEIFAECKLPTHPVPHGSAYVMQYRLGVFIYRRLCHSLERALSKRNENVNAGYWVLEGFDGTPAAGTEQQLDGLLSCLDNLMVREQSTASRLLLGVSTLLCKRPGSGFWDGCAREGAASLPSPSDVERFWVLMT